MRLVVRGSSLTFWSGPNTAAYQDVAPITTGQPGVGISSSEGDTIANVQLGPIDYLPPAAVNASAIETSTAPNRVDLRWPASAPDANSAGLQGYAIYRDGVYLGSTRAPNWLDQTVSGPESTAYSIYAADQHGSVSAPAQVTVQVPADPGAKPKTGAAAEIVLRKPSAKNVPDGPTADQREIGVMPTGSYWGAAAWAGNSRPGRSSRCGTAGPNSTTCTPTPLEPNTFLTSPTRTRTSGPPFRPMFGSMPTPISCISQMAASGT
jgi:hypothetical protein